MNICNVDRLKGMCEGRGRVTAKLRLGLELSFGSGLVMVQRLG